MATFVSGLGGSSTEWTIYTGNWINYDQGPILGATLTTTNQYGLILVSFIALFVGALSGYSWGIICFVVHQLRTTRVVEDGLYHQTQALLRNSQSPSATLWELIKVGWVWRGRARHSMARVLILIVIAATQVGFFVAAGILSSEIFSNSNEVLIRSPHCGYMAAAPGLDDFNASDYLTLNAQFVEQRTAADWAWTYMLGCYTENPGAFCNYLASPRIESTAQNVTCPFDDEVCLDPTVGGSFQVDSGYINSNKHLGVNAPFKDTLDYRRVTTCAPLNVESYSKVLPADYPGHQPGEQILGFLYGKYTFVNDTDITPADFTNVFSLTQLNYTSTYSAGYAHLAV